MPQYQQKAPTYDCTQWDGTDAARTAIHGYLTARGMEPNTTVNPDGTLSVQVGIQPVVLPRGDWAVYGPYWASYVDEADLMFLTNTKHQASFSRLYVAGDKVTANNVPYTVTQDQRAGDTTVVAKQDGLLGALPITLNVANIVRVSV